MTDVAIDLAVQFANPPVVETVIGVQFAPLANFTSAHFGWFWKLFLGKEWNTTGEAPLLQDQFERFGDQRMWGPVGALQITPGNRPDRIHIKNDTGDRLIQIQHTRFVFNWQKGKGSYPSFKKTSVEFMEYLARFQRFVKDAGLGELALNQWEMTYVNHMPKGTLWNVGDDWRKILPGLLGPTEKWHGLEFEDVGGEWRFEIVPQRGRLYASIQHGRAGSATGPEILVLQFTARGPILQQPNRDLQSGLEVGHEAIIRAFLSSTSSDARRSWGQK